MPSTGMNASRLVCHNAPSTETGFPNPFRLGAEGVMTGNGSNGQWEYKQDGATENDEELTLAVTALE
jgi:hypothetical protein